MEEYPIPGVCPTVYPDPVSISAADFGQNSAHRARWRLDVNDGRQGGCDVDGEYSAIYHSRFEVRARKDDGHVRVVVPGRSMGRRNDESIEVVDEPIRLEHDEDIARPLRVEVVLY